MKHDVAISDRRVIALQVQRPRRHDVSLDRSVGVAEDRLVVDHFLTVQNNCRVPINDDDLITLPLTTGLSGILRRRDPIED